MYPSDITQPMEQELIDLGFEALRTPEAVESALHGREPESTLLLVINSVCGCAAGNARPGVQQALARADKTPTRLATVFAGVDLEATDRARTYIDRRPSSPAMALFKGQDLVAFIPREEIEGHTAEQVAHALLEYFGKHVA